VSKVQNEAREKADYARRRIVVRLTIRLLAFVVALSFLATLLPLVRVSAASSTMACCIGKKEEESHCHASAKKKAAAHDHSTDRSKPAFKSAVQTPCSDCCACSISTRQQREKDQAQPAVKLVAPSVVVAKFFASSVPFSAKQTWAQISPRGPPSLVV
jgi:hypothetical protein